MLLPLTLSLCPVGGAGIRGPVHTTFTLGVGFRWRGVTRFPLPLLSLPSTGEKAGVRGDSKEIQWKSFL